MQLAENVAKVVRCHMSDCLLILCHFSFVEPANVQECVFYIFSNFKKHDFLRSLK